MTSDEEYKPEINKPLGYIPFFFFNRHFFMKDEITGTLLEMRHIRFSLKHSTFKTLRLCITMWVENLPSMDMIHCLK